MVLAVVVLLGAVAVLVVVLLLQPRVPYVAGAPLGDAGSATMEVALRDGVVPFRVDPWMGRPRRDGRSRGSSASTSGRAWRASSAYSVPTAPCSPSDASPSPSYCSSDRRALCIV
ncbi:hypothetical protein ZEAMMB73_Zm00001d002793 [Zea mays]|uniref:Uncharacterized protein n=1 Tax=Zea mays TaxID=4577 RepID=A0A1D6E4C5_MAIZE|nr:hypothetical protein ZEAMMB73_Zm00001d002793 [Zea mays]